MRDELRSFLRLSFVDGGVRKVHLGSCGDSVVELDIERSFVDAGDGGFVDVGVSVRSNGQSYCKTGDSEPRG